MTVFHDDDDMKIVGERLKRTKAEDPAETEARRFLAHQEAGNIEKAHNLGRCYANAIVDALKYSPLGGPGLRSQMETHQQMLLCSFLVTRVIGENSPDSILAQTSIHTFYDEVAASSAPISRHMSDLAAFSLYTLWERSRDKDESELGRIYARLCGMEGDRKVIEDGNILSRWFYNSCLTMMESIEYTAVEPALPA